MLDGLTISLVPILFYPEVHAFFAKKKSKRLVVAYLIRLVRLFNIFFKNDTIASVTIYDKQKLNQTTT